MAVIATYTQQPADRLDYDIPVDLNDGDSIASAVVTVTPAVGLTVNSLVVGDTVKLWVEAGTVGTYKAETTITTTLGRIKQVEVKFRIKEQ